MADSLCPSLSSENWERGNLCPLKTTIWEKPVFSSLGLHAFIYQMRPQLLTA